MKSVFMIMLAISFGLVMGCASVQKRSDQNTFQEPLRVEHINGKSFVKRHKDKIYKVKKNDCLWTIAASKNVYGDGFEWPVIFRDNRAQIKDANIIEPGQ